MKQRCNRDKPNGKESNEEIEKQRSLVVTKGVVIKECISLLMVI